MLTKLRCEENHEIGEVLEGLHKPRKIIPSKFFYDQYGSMLFDQICHQEEYYLARTEMRILRQHIGEIASELGEKCALVEFGSGNSRKTRLLLDSLSAPAAYLPIDISGEYLMKHTDELSREYAHIKVIPVIADFTRPFVLPDVGLPYSHKVIYFPGSTFGNFTPDFAGRLLESMAELAEKDGHVLITIDVRKDRETLEAAYNDKRGITAQFNLNILSHLNHCFEADFDTAAFAHQAFFNWEKGRIEMHLASAKDQLFHVGGEEFFVAENETILTEFSYKYTLDEFKFLVSDYFKIEHTWMDANRSLAIQHLRPL